MYISYLVCNHICLNLRKEDHDHMEDVHHFGSKTKIH